MDGLKKKTKGRQHFQSPGTYDTTHFIILWVPSKGPFFATPTWLKWMKEDDVKKKNQKREKNICERRPRSRRATKTTNEKTSKPTNKNIAPTPRPPAPLFTRRQNPYLNYILSWVVECYLRETMLSECLYVPGAVYIFRHNGSVFYLGENDDQVGIKNPITVVVVVFGGSYCWAEPTIGHYFRTASSLRTTICTPGDRLRDT